MPLTYVTSDSPKKPITVWLNKTYGKGGKALECGTLGTILLRMQIEMEGNFKVNDNLFTCLFVCLFVCLAHLNIKKRSSWFKANIQQTGFYRVNYEEANWLQLINQLNNNHKVP